MELFKTSNLKIKFLGIIPKDESLSSQEIISFSGLLTFKGKTVRKLLDESLEQGQDIKDKMKKILTRSCLRGHASMATTPVLSFSYEGSKFMDSALTGMYFGSFLVSSGRRTSTNVEDIIYPDDILKNEKAKEIYIKASKENIDLVNNFLSKDMRKDEASKILQYGIYGTGVMQLPIESIISLKRECQIEKEWMPKEIGLFLDKVESEIKKLGIDLVYSTRYIAPRNTYSYPNIFKNPDENNLVRNLMQTEELDRGSKVISMDVLITSDLKKKLESLYQKTKEVFSELEQIKEKWFDLLFIRRKILRDHNLALNFKILSSIPWRVWGEKKRHRTCPQTVESIYYCINRACETFNKFEDKIKNKDIDNEMIIEIEKICSIPPSVKENKDFLQDYLLTALQSFKAYQDLIELGIKPRDAIFLIPRAVKIDILQQYDLYNLLTGYYPLRLCNTAEEEMKRNTINEVKQIKDSLEKNGHAWLGKFIVPKCEIIGFCPEQKTCGYIKNSVKEYNQEFHKEMRNDLENKFEEVLSKINNSDEIEEC